MIYPNRVIKEGEKDTKIVKAVQQRLIELGCTTLNATGTFGPKTVAAVKQFQATHRDQQGNPLEMDGKLGSISWNVLFDNPVEESRATGSDLATEAVKAAISCIGVMEKPPGSNRGPEVDKYLSCVGCPPGLFWCAAFVYSTFNDAAKKLGRSNPLVKTAGCIDHWNRTKAKKITTTEAINNPGLLKPGDVFIISHGGGAGHTGIVEKIEGGFVHTIEGNSNPAGSRNGIGVFRLQRKIGKINKGFLQYK